MTRMNESLLMNRRIINLALGDPSFAQDTFQELPSEFFKLRIHKEVVFAIKKYYRSYNKPLTEEALLTMVESMTKAKTVEEKEDYFNEVTFINDMDTPEDNADYIFDELESYIRTNLSFLVLKDFTQYTKKDATPEVLEKVVKDITDVSNIDIRGKDRAYVNITRDFQEKREIMAEYTDSFMRSGFDRLDYLNGGGLAKQEMGQIQCLSGKGKTTIMVNLATSYARRGKNVLYLALEERKNRMVLKLDQALVGAKKEKLMKGAEVNTPAYDALQNFMSTKTEEYGNLYLKNQEPGTMTIANIEKIIHRILTREGVRIDVLVVDYPELMKYPKTGNEASDGEELYKSLRGLAGSKDVALWVASQQNRGANNQELRTSESMEGSYRKQNSCDMIMTFNQTQVENEHGFFRLFGDKLRNPPDDITTKLIVYKYNRATNQITEANKEETLEHEMLMEKAVEIDKKRRQSNYQEKNSHFSDPQFNERLNSQMRNNRGQT